MILAVGRHWGAAEAHLSFVVATQPDRAEAVYWLAVAKKNRGAVSEALELCRHAANLSPRNPLVLNELGLCLMAVNRPDQALEYFRRAVRASPTDGAFMCNLGMAQARLDLIYKARESFEEALRLDPSMVLPCVELATILETLNERLQSIRMLRSAIERHPVNFHLHTLLAHALANNGETKAAEDLYRRTMAADPASAQAYGLWLQQQGRFEESIACFERSLDADPVQGVSYYGLAEAKAFDTSGPSLIERGTAAMAAPGLDLKAKAYLCYALGRAYEHAHDYEQAMRYFELGNQSAYRVYNEGRPYSRADISNLNNRSMQLFSTLSRRSDRLDPISPIFIVGMIRSGTTLLDQIVSSHPDVKSAGEPVFWMREADRIRRLSDPTLPIGDLDEISERYLSELVVAAGNAPRITDKMPLNYAHLGLIHAAFPSAKIIHMRRNPMDTCLSIYTTYLGHGPNFAYDRDNIVFNYQEYLRLMSHWRSGIPANCLLEIDYEELVRDRESISRGVIEFSGLPWDEACLRYEENDTSIRTPSRWQARQPVYGSSVERWRRFEPWLGALLELRGVRHP